MLTILNHMLFTFLLCYLMLSGILASRLISVDFSYVRDTKIRKALYRNCKIALYCILQGVLLILSGSVVAFYYNSVAIHLVALLMLGLGGLYTSIKLDFFYTEEIRLKEKYLQNVRKNKYLKGLSDS